MPPELKTITMQVTALFFGTYALRELKNRALAGRTLAPAAIAGGVGLPRRSLSRHLSYLVDQKQVNRQARHTTDPQARYALAT